MRFDDQKNKFIVSFNELETNNELMIEKVVKWILNTEFFQNNCVFLCKWQSIKEPTRFQDKRGYLVDNKLKDKIIKKFTIKQADITYYFATSEQTPSSVGLGVLMTKENTVNVAGGFIIQIMPDATDETITAIEQKISTINSVTSMLENGLTPEGILELILGDLGLEVLDLLPIRFYCNCSKERVSKALIAIGKIELENIINEGKPIEVKCHFCNKSYSFDIDELKKLKS